jgi:predicted ATPase/class 3 adenylate cyclase/uncharacterized protein HemY
LSTKNLSTKNPLAAPAGDVTLMFTDIQGSTRGWQTYAERFHEVLQRHNELVRQALAAHDGYEVKTIGDAFMAAFSTPLDAALCALDIQRLIEAEPFPHIGSLRVRIGLHTASMTPAEGDYFGSAVNRAARIEGAAHGSMILISEETALRLQDELPFGASLIDHGMHRLKDLSTPLNLFQLAHADLPFREYPPLNTLVPDTHNFPAQVTSFVGRERELEELSLLLSAAGNRLITLTGSGGTGKTRLSLQVAAQQVHHYKHGVWLVELAGVTQAQDVPAAVALALGIPLSSDGEASKQIFSYLRERACLLVLDNFEQVVDAALFVSDLLKQCAQVSVLVSSRELLQIAGETEYPLSPLELPDVETHIDLKTWTQFAGLRLFVERCQSARPNFTVTTENLGDVTEICRRLEGLPLAVELTSALVRGMTPQQIVPRLQDRFRVLASSRRDLDPRQRSMRGAIDWSYDLLNEDERALFAELSVFAGGFDLEAAEAVCETPGVFDLVYSLRDKSLLRVVETEETARFFMLETLRDYAREKRDQAQRDETNARHSAYYLTLAQQWSEQLGGAGEAIMAQKRFRADIDNMRAGMDWAIKQDDCDRVAAYGRSLARFFLARGLYSEGDQRLALAEQACRQGGDQKSLALLLIQRGRIAFQRSQLDAARRFYEESYTLSKQTSDTPRLVAPLINLGQIAWAESDYEKARQFWEEGLTLARKTEQPRYQAMLLGNLGILVSERGDFEEAKRHYEEALAIHRGNKDTFSIAYALMHVGDTAMRQKQYASAYQNMRDSHDLFAQLGRQHELALTCIHLGHILMEQGRFEEAHTQIQEGLRIGISIEDAWSEMYGLSTKGLLLGRQARFSEAYADFRQALRIAQRLNDRRQIAHLLVYAGLTLELHERFDAAYSTLYAAHRELTTLQLWDVNDVDTHLRRLEAEPGEENLRRLREESATQTVQTLFDQF